MKSTAMFCAICEALPGVVIPKTNQGPQGVLLVIFIFCREKQLWQSQIIFFHTIFNNGHQYTYYKNHCATEHIMFNETGNSFFFN